MSFPNITRERHWIDIRPIDPSMLGSPRHMPTAEDIQRDHDYRAAVVAAERCRRTGEHTPYTDPNYNEIFCRTCEDYLGPA